MSTDAGSSRKPYRFEPALSQIRSRQMGELARADSRWDVLLETAADDQTGALRGRVHFVSGTTHRLSAWIFLEWAEQEVLDRFSDFSAPELWNLLESLS